MENIFKQLESTNPKVAVEKRTKIAHYLSKFMNGGDVASKQIKTKMSFWGKEFVDESGEKKHIGVQVHLISMYNSRLFNSKLKRKYSTPDFSTVNSSTTLQTHSL